MRPKPESRRSRLTRELKEATAAMAVANRAYRMSSEYAPLGPDDAAYWGEFPEAGPLQVAYDQARARVNALNADLRRLLGDLRREKARRDAEDDLAQFGAWEGI